MSTRIVTNHNEMSNVLDKVRMRGTDTDGEKVSLVGDVILTFDEEEGQVETKVFDGMRSVWCHLRKDFDGIREGGELVIGNIKDFTKYLERFGENVVVEQREDEHGERIYFEDENNKRGSITATEREHIASKESVDELPFEYDEEADEPVSEKVGPIEPYFVTEASEMQSILSDGDTTQVREYPISLEDGEVDIRVGDQEGWIQNTIETEGDGVADTVYAYGMGNVFPQLSGEIKVHIMTDGPMWIHHSDGEWTLDYMIAEKTE